MEKPVATYRVQLNRDFGFNQLKEVLPYLAKLGISHVYASPIFQARKTSTHGYDIVDPNGISEELGGQAGFEEANRECAALGLGWIQDIVPNHVAYSMESGMIRDVLRKGMGSKFYGFLDVDWNHPCSLLKGKIMMPFLEKTYEECLRQGEFKLVYSNEALALKYKGTEYPLNEETRREVLGESLQPSKAAVEEALKKCNQDLTLLDELISKQIFVLTHWKTALKQINYRRFFDIIDLICICTEQAQVFEETHRLIFELLSQGKSSGVRVDHVDGLYNPEEYLNRIRKRNPEAFVVVEKILTGEEKLPLRWRVQGTTGYDFLNYLNKLFVDSEKEEEFDAAYTQFTGNSEPFNNLLYDCKKKVITEYFEGDIDNLSILLCQALQKGSIEVNFACEEMKNALVELLACFPVYRTYLTEKNTGAQAQRYWQEALALAEKRNPQMQQELAAIRNLLKEASTSSEALAVLMRLQQFTGVFMAKGFEDTALYRYSRLLSLNDVGSDPSKFGCTPQEFHAFNQTRRENWPLSMNATSTHDTKRGEDVRARINVLSEIPQNFSAHVRRWSSLNAAAKTDIEGKPAPDGNEEWYIYQTLLGAYPFSREEMGEFVERIRAHLVKALREAKVHSNWLSPIQGYEQAVMEFAKKILDPREGEAFLNDIHLFQQKLAMCGIFNSLSQTLLKITSPGTPDFYQGAELWDLNLVDPDNRRPVDFLKRQQLLEKVAEADSTRVQDFLAHPEDGKVKLYMIYKALQARRKYRKLFEEGEHVPLDVEGVFRRHIVAFCRKKGDHFALTAVPRFVASLTKFGGESLEGFDWKDTRICLPKDAPTRWQNIFTGEILAQSNTSIAAAELFKSFPVALLFSRRNLHDCDF